MFSPFQIIRQESLRKLLAERDVWQKRIAELERENTELFSIASGLTQRIDQLQSENAALKDRVRELEDEIAQLNAGEDY